MLVGEQPGDREDVDGLPFVGPAGRLLTRAQHDADIDPGRTYQTKCRQALQIQNSPASGGSIRNLAAPRSSHTSPGCSPKSKHCKTIDRVPGCATAAPCWERHFAILPVAVNCSLGRKVAFLVAPEGVEQIELTTPWNAVCAVGGQPALVSIALGSVQAFNHLDRVLRVTVDGDVAVIGVGGDPDVRTAPLGVVSGAVVGLVTGCPSR
jgi:hypothetical protein